MSEEKKPSENIDITAQDLIKKKIRITEDRKKTTTANNDQIRSSIKELTDYLLKNRDTNFLNQIKKDQRSTPPTIVVDEVCLGIWYQDSLSRKRGLTGQCLGINVVKISNDEIRFATTLMKNKENDRITVNRCHKTVYIIKQHFNNKDEFVSSPAQNWLLKYFGPQSYKTFFDTTMDFNDKVFENMNKIIKKSLERIRDFFNNK